MANISTIEPIRYNQDLAVSTNSGLIICDESNRIDLTYVTTISKMTITTIPATLPSTTDVRFMFLTGDNWFKLDTSGNAVNVVDSKNLTIDVMQESGNTISELTALTNLPGLLTNTKYLRYAIAIIDNAPSDTIPKVKFSMTCKRSGSLAIHEFKSPQYTFTNNIYVLSSVASESLPGALAGSLKGYIWQYVDYGENYSSTVYDLANFKDIVTNKIQFRPYINTQYNEGTYSVDKITLNFLPDKKASTYEDVDEVVNIIHSINKSLSKCRVLVRHSPLENNNSIQCYVLTRSKGKKVTKEVLGKGTGSRTTYTLAHRNNIYYDSIKLYINNVEQNIAYHGVNTSTGTLSFIAPANATISCTYEYDWNFKEWKELKLDHSYEDLTNPTIINSIYRLKTNYSFFSRLIQCFAIWR